MNPIKQLAGQTGLYGISSILGRVLNYFLIYLHTAVFMEAEFGVMNYLYAQVAFLNILFTYGMETAFFRFSGRFKEQNYYQVVATLLLISSLVLSGFIFLFAADIAAFVGVSEKTYIIKWLAGILFIDAVVAIPFAKLRLENKALRFVSIRIIGILITIFLNIIFLYSVPQAISGAYGSTLQAFFTNLGYPDYGIGYVFLANLLGNAFMLLLLYKELFAIRIVFDYEKVKPLLRYALPIMIMGLLGTVPEQIDKIFIKHFLPDDFYADKNAAEALGVYSAAFKLSIFMTLAIQAFRFAGEPFFFSRAEEKNAPKLFADVLYYFTLVCLVIFVAVSLNVELIASIFLRQAAYREALFLVPILLFGKLFYGMYTHLTVWFKLTDKTTYGIWLSGLGAVITVLGNILLIPYIGYLGSAVASVLCYLSMTFVCYRLGQKNFPVPYPVAKIGLQILIACAIVGLFFMLDIQTNWLLYTSGFVLSITYAAIIFFIEKQKLAKK